MFVCTVILCRSFFFCINSTFCLCTYLHFDLVYWPKLDCAFDWLLYKLFSCSLARHKVVRKWKNISCTVHYREYEKSHRSSAFSPVLCILSLWFVTLFLLHDTVLNNQSGIIFVIIIIVQCCTASAPLSISLLHSFHSIFILSLQYMSSFAEPTTSPNNFSCFLASNFIMIYSLLILNFN